MKKELIKKKLLLSALSLALISSTGCKNTNETPESTTKETTECTQSTTTEYIEPETENINTESNTTEHIEVITTEEYIESTTEESISKDDEVINNFNKDKEEIEYYLSSDDIDFEIVKSKGKAFFIKCVDFIFYDSTVNGVTFDELSEDAKEDVYETFCYTDELIMEFVPNYKENISEKYQIVKDFTNKAYYSSLDKIKEAIGEENYNKVGEIKDNALNTISNTKDDVKIKVKDWYEDFKEN